jgi:hypothetical protein
MTQTPDLTTTVEIASLPIFQAGSYPQGDFDVSDLQALADAYDPSFHEAPNYLDHEDDAGRRPAGHLSFGWVKRLYVKGQTLFADLTQVPKFFAELVLAGRIKKRSIELYTNLNGKGRYLRALAWPMIPQIKGLPDLHPTQIFNDSVDPFISLTSLTEFSSEILTTFNEKDPKMNDPQFITQDQITQILQNFKTDLLAELKTLQAATQAKNFCEQMVLAGKMTPAERSTEEPLLIAQLQKEQTMTFSENETPLSTRRMDYYRNRTTVLPLNSSQPPAEAPEHQKLVQYFHENQAFFEKMNVTLEDLIAADRANETNPLTH